MFPSEMSRLGSLATNKENASDSEKVLEPEVAENLKLSGLFSYVLTEPPSFSSSKLPKDVIKL